LGQGTVKILLTLLSEADAMTSILRDEESTMNVSILRLSDAEVALLEYVEKYGLTDRARNYFQNHDPETQQLSSVWQNFPRQTGAIRGDKTNHP